MMRMQARKRSLADALHEGYKIPKVVADEVEGVYFDKGPDEALERLALRGWRVMLATGCLSGLRIKEAGNGKAKGC